MKHLITADDLIGLMADKTDLAVFDCRFSLTDHNYARVSYLKEHIEGAYYINLEDDLSGHKGIHGGNHPFADPTALKVLLESFGVSNDTKIVIYDHGDFNGPARMLSQLLHAGLSNSYILTGGINTYKAAGGKTESGYPRPKPTPRKLKLSIDVNMVVTMPYVRDKLYDSKTIIIDSRSNSRYLGLEEPLYRIAGHIPSAKSYYYGDTLQGTALKNLDFLQQHFKDLEKAEEVILSCGSGVSATVNSLALRQLGMPHKIYVGSYSDWLSYPENEVKQGLE